MLNKLYLKFFLSFSCIFTSIYSDSWSSSYNQSFNDSMGDSWIDDFRGGSEYPQRRINFGGYKHPWGEISQYRVNGENRYYPFSGGGVLDYQDTGMEDLVGAGTTCYEADNFAVNRRCDELLV